MGRKITQYPNNVSVTPDELSLLDVSEKTGLATYESRKWTLLAFKAWLNANITIPSVNGTQGQIPLFVQDDEIGSNTRFTFIDNEGTEVGFRFSDSAGNLTQAGVTFLNVETQGLASNSVARLANWSDTTNKGILSFRKSRGDKLTPTQIFQNDILGHILFTGQHNSGSGTTTGIIEVVAKENYDVNINPLTSNYERYALTEYRIYLAPSFSESGTSSGFPNNLVFTVDGDGKVSFKNYDFPLLDGSAGNSLITDGAGQLTWGTPTASSANSMQTIGRNSTGSTLRKGTIISISGSTGNRPNFVKAQANTEATSAGTFGVIVNDIPNNSDGYALTIGTLETLDTRSNAPFPFTTDTLADGDTLYLSPTNAGYVTNVKPSAPNHLVYIGKVVRTTPNLGTIVYRIQNGYELEELHNVAISSLADNDILQYESSTQLWKNKPFSGIDGSGTLNKLAKFTPDGNTLGDSKISEDGTYIIFRNAGDTADIFTLNLTTGQTNIVNSNNNYINYIPSSSTYTLSNETNMFSFTLRNVSDNFWQHIRFIRLRADGSQPLSGEKIGSIGHLGMYNFIIEATENHNATTQAYGKQIVLGGTQNGQNVALRTLILTQDNKVKISDAFHLPNTDGTNGQVLVTDGAGNVSWGTGSSSSAFIPSLQGNEVFKGVSHRYNSVTYDTYSGYTMNITGAQFVKGVGTGSYYARQIMSTYTPTATGTGAYGCLRGATQLWSISGGFYFVCEYAIADTGYAVGTHNFVGLTIDNTALSIGSSLINQPSALTNIIAVANDSGDANLQIMHNDASGVATKIDLGTSFPSNRTSGSALTTVYFVEFYNSPSSTSVKYRVTNKETGVVQQGTLSTNLPSTSNQLTFQVGRSMGTSAGGVNNTAIYAVGRLGFYNI